MSFRQIMSELKQMGTAQNRKVYGRHGVGAKMYGVSYANMNVLRKRIKTDHELALQLWASGNHDARILATMVADPEQMDSKALEAWVKELDNYVLSDAFTRLVVGSSLARKKSDQWSRSRQEWIGRAGWRLTAHLAMGDAELEDAYFAEKLATIEGSIHKSKNRVRDSMNGAVIAIGLRNGKLEKQAMAAARRIGKVEVNHGETGCKTPDAIAYIQKAKARKKGQKAKKQ